MQIRCGPCRCNCIRFENATVLLGWEGEATHPEARRPITLYRNFNSGLGVMLLLQFGVTLYGGNMSIFMILVLLSVSVNEAANDEVLKEPGYEEVVVTATRTSQQRGSFGNAGYEMEFKSMEFERSGKNSVVDLLKSVPGVFVKLQGGIGSVSSISLRGYKYTLVMLDGIKLADYMGNGGSGFPVLDHLSSDEIERIEFISSQSTSTVLMLWVESFK